MSTKTRNVILIINSLLFVFMVMSLILFFSKLELYAKIIALICVLISSIIPFIMLKYKTIELFKSSFLINTVISFVILFFLIFNLTGIFENFKDLDNIKNIILSAGSWGYLICFLIVIFQVVILPIPALLIYLAITAVYGSWIAFLICYLATIIGSFLAFVIGKKLGKSAIVWCIGYEKTEKYSFILGNKGKLPFILMQILPFFPDDILCMVAGLSSMSYRFFIISMICIKPIYIALVCFLGTGTLIPFSGWGIPVWITIFAVIIVGCIIYYKNQTKIENWIKSKRS